MIYGVRADPSRVVVNLEKFYIVYLIGEHDVAWTNSVSAQVVAAAEASRHAQQDHYLGTQVLHEIAGITVEGNIGPVRCLNKRQVPFARISVAIYEIAGPRNVMVQAKDRFRGLELFLDDRDDSYPHASNPAPRRDWSPYLD